MSSREHINNTFQGHIHLALVHDTLHLVTRCQTIEKACRRLGAQCRGIRTGRGGGVGGVDKDGKGGRKHPDLPFCDQLPVHGGICQRSTGNQFPLGLVIALCSLARGCIVCFGCGGGSEGQAGC